MAEYSWTINNNEVPLAWVDTDGDGVVDTYLTFTDSGIWQKSGNKSKKLAANDDIVNWDKEKIMTHIESTINQYYPNAASGKDWDWNADLGGQGTGAGQSTEEWSGAKLGEEGGIGGQTIDYTDLEGEDAGTIFDILQAKGIIPAEAKFADYEDQIENMPIKGGVSDEDRASFKAGIAEDVYGFETDISRAGEDMQSARDAYALAEGRGLADIKTAGIGARSDIYGLHSQGAQQRRAGMFGKGLGGGMQALKGQDISGSMQLQGGSRMQALGQQTLGLRRGIEDAGIARDDAILGYQRTISDAQADLYGVPGDADGDGIIGLDERVGGIYGAGGSEATGEYDLEQAADAEWEGDFSTWAANLIGG